MTKREHLHSLVDSLAEDEVHVAIRFLEFLESDIPSPRLWSLEDAPVDDEPLTAEEQKALAEAEEDIAEGRVVSHAEARRRLLGDVTKEDRNGNRTT